MHEIKINFKAKIDTFLSNLKQAQNGMTNTIDSIKAEANNLNSISFDSLPQNMQKNLEKLAIVSKQSLSSVMESYNEIKSGLDLSYASMSLNEIRDDFVGVKQRAEETARSVADFEREKQKLEKNNAFGKNDAEIASLDSKIKNASNSLNKYRIAAVAIKEALDGIVQKQKEVEITAPKAPKTPENKSEGLDGGIKKGIRSLKIFSLALIGVRSIYASIRGLSSLVFQNNDALRAQMESIKLTLAGAIAPVVESIVGLIAKIVPYIVLGISYIYSFLNGLFGCNLQVKKFNQGLKNSTANARKTAAGVKKIGEELGGLAGFDEITQIQTKASDAGGGAGAGGVQANGGAVSLTEPKISTKITKKLKKIGQFINKYKKIIGIGLLAIGAAFLIFKAKSKEAVKGGSNLVGVALVIGSIALVIKTFTELVKAFAESGKSLPEVLVLIGGAMGILTLSIQSMALAFKGFDASAILPMIAIFGGLSLVLYSVANMIKVMGQNAVSTKAILAVLLTVFGGIATIMGLVATLGPQMTAGLVPFLAIVGGISALLTVMSLTLPTILKAASNFITAIAPVIIKILDTIGKNIAIIIKSLGTYLPPIIQSVGDMFTKIFSGVSKVIDTVGNVIIRIMETADRLVSNVLRNIITFINELGPAIENFVDRVIRVTTKLINFIISGIEYLVNLVISGVNGIIKAINKIGDKVGVHVDKAPKFNIPRFVPKLASGGVATGSTIAEIGEGRYKEAVIPLEQSPQFRSMKSDIAQEVAELLGNGKSNGYAKVEIDILAGGVRLGKKLIELQERTKDAYGLD